MQKSRSGPDLLAESSGWARETGLPNPPNRGRNRRGHVRKLSLQQRRDTIAAVRSALGVMFGKVSGD